MIGSVLDQPGVSSAPDEALMKDISRQRHAALTELYGRHGQTLKAMIDSVVHEEAEAGDVLQETLLQIWNEADHYSPKVGKPLGWIITIARRRAIDRLRRRHQREAVELAFFKGLSHSEIATATHAPLGTVKTRLELGLQKLTHAIRPLRHKI